MRNFKIYIDLTDTYLELMELDLRICRTPFEVMFLEADNPDDACDKVLKRIVLAIMKESESLKNRILCEKIKRTIRIDRINPL